MKSRRAFCVLFAGALISAFSSQPSLAQIDVTGSTTNANSLRDVLLGGGITPVGNATLTSGAQSAGFFTNGANSIGINSGIILATGSVFSAEPPNNNDGITGNASGAGDATLNALLGANTTRDTTALQFDFTTTGGDLFFNFVFASEEYNEFTNDQFNDVFGFFVDGVNIALIPGTNTRVSINTVNGGNPLGVNATNPQFFNNNDMNDGGGYLNLIQYDGFTDVFTAAALGLGPGQHTIKLAISDVGDANLDSAVFIEAGTFQDESPANPSFDNVNDVNVLNISFGNLQPGVIPGNIAAAITNLQTSAATLELDLVSIVGAGDTSILGSDLALFANLAPAASHPFLVKMLQTAAPGSYSASYALNFADDLGSMQTLTLNISATVVPEPGTIVLAASMLIGLAGALRGRRSAPLAV